MDGGGFHCNRPSEETPRRHKWPRKQSQKWLFDVELCSSWSGIFWTEEFLLRSCNAVTLREVMVSYRNAVVIGYQKIALNFFSVAFYFPKNATILQTHGICPNRAQSIPATRGRLMKSS
jgi:hypothetical protein